MIDKEDIRKLLKKTEWTAHEKQELYDFIANQEANELSAVLSDLYQEDIAQGAQIDTATSSLIFDQMMSAIEKRKELPSAHLPAASGARIRSFGWIKMAAAACLVFLIGGLVLFTQSKQRPLAGRQKAMHTENSIHPGENGAVLTLADGRTIMIDSNSAGVLASQMGVVVRKTTDGQIQYQSTMALPETGDVKWNTLATPKGHSFQVVLPDGTRVWLNAAASLRYPITFSGKERNVQLSGEGYFEVAKNPSMPFVVDIIQGGTLSGKVKVLGTHFNIKAYADEHFITTTLLEGAIEYKKENAAAQKIVPGQQVIQENSTGKVYTRETGDDDAAAWVNGNFNFHNTPLWDIMKQIGRWYNVEIVYNDNVPDLTFSGSIARNSSLEKVLKILEISGAHFSVTGNKIAVLSDQ